MDKALGLVLVSLLLCFCCFLMVAIPYIAGGTALYQGVKALNSLTSIIRLPFSAASQAADVITKWFYDSVESGNIDPTVRGGASQAVPDYLPGHYGTVGCVGVEIEPVEAACRVPVEGYYRVSGRYGSGAAEGYTTAGHKGIDWATYQGSYPITAVMKGGSIYSNWHTAGYGYLVVVENFGWQTFYGHICCGPNEYGLTLLSSGGPTLAVGSSRDPENPVIVDVGTFLGMVGNTGNSTGPHLHFEVRECTIEPPTSTFRDPDKAILPGFTAACGFSHFPNTGPP